ncbi:MAG: hypothetical protein Q8R15_03230 [Candidatus Micrarchaeota archaeon]|nr:hypothetical protein [Candidatus Micrarchaeota archaeon]
MAMEYRTLPRGFGKIQLLSAEAMFGKNGIWHARNSPELSAAISAHSSALSEIAQDRAVSPIVRQKLQDAIHLANGGNSISDHDSHELVPMLNSAAFRTAGSSTMKWTAWVRGGKEGLKVVSKPKRFRPVSDLPQAEVFVQVGNDLFDPISATTGKVTRAVVGAIDETRRRYPTAKVDEFRELAAKVAEEGVFEPQNRKALMKVDYKLVRGKSGRTRAAVIDVSSELLGAGFTDEVLKTYKLPSGLAKSLAHAFLNIHKEESGTLPKTVAIMVRDKQLAETFKRDIGALRDNVERILRQSNPDAAVNVVLQQSVESRVKGVRSGEARGFPFTGLKVQDFLTNKSTSPDLLIRYGRFPLSDETDAYLKSKGVKVLDKSDYVVAADKTVNGRVLNILKLEPENTVFVPRNSASQHSIFTRGYEQELDTAIERAKIEQWSGLVVKLPTKLAIGETGQEAVTAHFVNPHSPLQVNALKRAISLMSSRGNSLPASEKNKAKLTFEELAVSSLPELGGKGLEIRTLAMPRFKVVGVKKFVSPA